MTTAEYGLSKAARSFNSRLDKSKLVEAGFTPLPTWQHTRLRNTIFRKYKASGYAGVALIAAIVITIVIKKKKHKKGSVKFDEKI